MIQFICSLVYSNEHDYICYCNYFLEYNYSALPFTAQRDLTDSVMRCINMYLKGVYHGNNG